MTRAAPRLTSQYTPRLPRLGASFPFTGFLRLTAMALLISSFLWIGTAAAQSETSDAMPDGTKDPIFVTLQTWGDINGKAPLSVNLQSNTPLCRAYYGDKNYWRGCSKRLGMAGQRADQGITITPAIKGEWRWEDDDRLNFTPSEYWHAGTHYTVAIDLDAMNVPSSVRISSDDKTHARRGTLMVNSENLNIAIGDMGYMQDPDTPSKRLVSARLSFNYPVTPEALKNSLSFEEDGVQVEDAPFELTVANDHLSAVVTYPIKKLPDVERSLLLTVAGGLAPEFGGKTSRGKFTERTRIPSIKTWLAINKASATITRDAAGTPHQSLMIETNVKADPANILAKTTVYLLPEHHPATSAANQHTDAKDKKNARPYAWGADNEVTPEILALSTKITPRLMDEGKGKAAAPSHTSGNKSYATQTALLLDVPAKRYVYVIVEEGLEAFAGYTLEKPFRAIRATPEWPHDIAIMQEGSILSLNGSKTLSLHARGTDALDIRIAQILPSALHHFITQTEGDIRTPNFRNWTFDEDDIAQIDTKTIKMAYASPYESQYAALDFAPYLKDGKKGIFLLGITGRNDGKITGKTQQRFVMVSDLGLMVKTGADGARHVFVASFSGGEPTDKAQITVLGRNGLAVFNGETDKDGHVQIPDLSGFSQQQSPVAIIAQKGDDFSFIPFYREDRLINTSRFDVGGNRIAANGLTGFAFTDRGIYRPGEEAHIAFIVKDADWSKPTRKALPNPLPLKAVITDPRGRIALEEIIPFGAEGFESITLPTTELSATGHYTANLYITQDGAAGAWLGSTTFQVEDFQPDRMTIKTTFKSGEQDVTLEEGWVKPHDLAARVMLKNLYGTPASNRKITGQVSLSPAKLSFKAWPDFHFYDAYPAKPRQITYALEDTTTDDKGEAVLPLNLMRQDNATYAVSVETRGFEAGSGRGVTAFATIASSPMDFAVGIKTTARTAYLKQGGTYGVDVIAVAPDLSPLAAKGLRMTLYGKSFVSSLVKRGDGSFAYESVERIEKISTEDYAIAKTGTHLVLPSDALGDFIYKIEGKDGLVHAEIPFSVAGEGQRSKGLDKETTLSVKLSSERIKPGDDVELHITAPYAGAGLITVEGESVAAYQWFKTTTTDSLQRITIPADFAGKGYISVAFFRDINAKEIYASPLSTAIVPFIADPAAQTLALTLDVPDVVPPASPVTVTYSANKKGKAIIFAVDEGILQVARYQTPDPLDFFLLNRALQVETAQMLDLLMPEYALVKELSAHGGGAAAMDAAMGKHLNPFRRKTLAPAVFWSGFVDVDTTPRSLTITPPGHFNGTMRVMAVAVSADGLNNAESTTASSSASSLASSSGAMGHAEHALTVRGALIVTPVVPNTLAPTDEAEISATIANNLPFDESGSSPAPQDEIGLSATVTGGVEIITPFPASITIARGSEQSVTMRIKANEALGNADIRITATATGEGGAFTQSAEASLSVRPATPLQTSLSSGYAEKGLATITPSRALFPQKAEKTLAASALPTPFIVGLTRYLDGFAYGCTEQIISKAMPQLMTSGLLPANGAGSAKDSRAPLIAAIATLRMRQTEDGGFSLWNGGYEEDDLASLHATEFLLRAREAGLAVPSDMVDPALRYLRDWVNRAILTDADARAKAHGIYLLTRGGYVTTNEILHVTDYFGDRNRDWKADFTGLYIAASYAMMQQKTLADDTLDAFEAALKKTALSFAAKPADKGALQGPWTDIYNPFVIQARAIAITAEYFPQRFETLDPASIRTLAGFVKESRYNTLSAAYAIDAFAHYASMAQKRINQSNITVTADDQALERGGDEYTIPIDAQSIALSIDPAQALYYTLSETGFDRDALAQAAFAQGLEVSRHYRLPDGTLLGGELENAAIAIPLGDVIEAVITIRATEKPVESVAIVDILPAGFIPESSGSVGLNSVSGSNFVPQFAEQREDRIILFGDIPTQERVFIYRLRAAAKGDFIIPPVYAEAMYNITQKARGTSGHVTIADDKP